MDSAVRLKDVLAARERLRSCLAPTPLHHQPLFDRAVGHGVRVLVKHEAFQPTGSFKVRNALSALTLLSAEARARGVCAASRGNHGLGLAWAGQRLGIPVTVCVPIGNNPEKNEAMRALGAELCERGRDYDEAAGVAHALAAERGLYIVHSTNDPTVIAGAGTMALEILEQAPEVEALVIAVGGGSQAVGALTVVRALRPEIAVYGVQAAGASAIHDGFHSRRPVAKPSADTFADGLATRACYELTFGALCAGLRDFVIASETELADAVRLYLHGAHCLTEGAGAAGLAGLRKLAPQLAGKTVAIVQSGANIDAATLRRVLDGAV